MARIMTVKRAKELQKKHLDHIIKVGEATGKLNATDFFDIVMEYCKHRIILLLRDESIIPNKGTDENVRKP